MDIEDKIRELDKVWETLDWAEKHFERDSASKAALHCDERVLHSPLALKVINAKKSIAHLQHELMLERDGVTIDAASD